MNFAEKSSEKHRIEASPVRNPLIVAIGHNHRRDCDTVAAATVTREYGSQLRIRIQGNVITGKW